MGPVLEDWCICLLLASRTSQLWKPGGISEIGSRVPDTQLSTGLRLVPGCQPPPLAPEQIWRCWNLVFWKGCRHQSKFSFSRSRKISFLPISILNGSPMLHKTSVLKPSHNLTSYSVKLSSVRVGELGLSRSSSVYALCLSFHNDKMGTNVIIPISWVVKLDKVCQVLRKVSGTGT